ncbi:uncharacterized protein LOC105224069 isoform X1 [Bactrocera dorsalis]|uniref:Uncharacterized protein LOC105224069 isoform X1 n=1 Tax=Bactrocera dorsalis TaxID=27457 RepID=A0ABM3KA44_BACDO|nr:uncharacterized protein LOC105224069 isoform X1 [Bactrocera dorsalis]XP_049318347.1 uncharacterized protein LOC105224069 isoform X1 [Bactrocera dorsalis]
MSSSLFNIEKLDESNYDSWSIQLKSVLVHQELWSVASGETPCPEADADGKNVLMWKAKDEKATATIILSITTMQIAHVKNSKTSNEAWNTLREIHRPKGPVRKVTLFKRLLAMRMSDDECVQQYVCKFTSLAEKLEEIGVGLQEEFFVIMLLASLPKSFENLVVALESRDELPKLNSIKIKLIEEGERRKSCVTKNTEGSVQAFMVRESSIKKNSSTNLKLNEVSSASNNNNKNKRHNMKCYSCGKKGHFAAQCREKQNVQKQQNSDNNRSNGLFAAISKNLLHTEAWCVDSGASSHLCCDRDKFSEFELYEEEIILAGDNKMLAAGRGIVRLQTNMFDVTLVKVLFVPGLQCNFISVSKAVNSGYKVEFTRNEAMIKNKRGDVILSANKVCDLFIFEPNKNQLFFACKPNHEAMKWHSRYGHLNFASLRKLSNNNMVRGMKVNIPADIQCVLCMSNKCSQRPYNKSDSRAEEILGLIHTDVCGPMRHESIGGAKYVLTFTDDKTRFVFVYFLRRKDEVLEKFKDFKQMIECQTEKRIKMLRSDNGTEFVHNAFNKFLKEHGIVRQLTVPYTPQQNGVAERLNRTLIEMARCMVVSSGVNESLWVEAVNTAVYLRNRASTKALNAMTQYEACYGYKPVVGHLRTFGSLAIALDKKQKDKFKPRGKEYVMVGYSDTSKAYRLYDKQTGRLIVSRDVYFVESISAKQHDGLNMKVAEGVQVHPIEFDIGNEFQQQGTHLDTNAIENVEEVVDTAANSDNDFESAEEEQLDDIPLKRGPGRPRLVRSGGPGRPTKQYTYLNLIDADDVKVPESVEQVLSSEYATKWYDAMQNEYNSLMKNETWQLAEIPKGQKAVRCKWVYALKRDKEGKVDRFKARLVAKGYSQVYGVNYDETFSPVVRYSTIQMIFALAAEYGLHLHQMDVSTAYLNSELSEDIYMRQPEMFIDKRFPNHCLKLNKALYGLKQSGRQWNLRLDEILKKIGFQPCISEPCVYINKQNGQINIIAVYVDDLLIASSDLKHMHDIKASIAREVEVVDKGPVQHFLSMEVNRDGKTGSISIGQKAYIRKLLNDFGMNDTRPIAVPLDAGHQINCNNTTCKKVDQVQYLSLIGSLMYLAVCTRPDILHSACKLAQRNNDPHTEHLAAAKRILRYLNTTQDKKLKYQQTGKDMEGFVDADWGGDSTDRKSYTGYAFVLAGCVFSYESKKTIDGSTQQH